MSTNDPNTPGKQLQSPLEEHAPTEWSEQDMELLKSTLRDEQKRQEYFERLWREKLLIHVKIDGQVLTNAGVTRTFALSRMLGFPPCLPFSDNAAPNAEERKELFQAMMRAIDATVERHGGRLEEVVDDADDDDYCEHEEFFESDVCVTYEFPNGTAASDAAREIMEAWEIYGVLDLG